MRCGDTRKRWKADRAIGLRAGFAEAHGNRGGALNELQQYQAALESLDQAIQLNPDYAEAHSNRGNALAGSSSIRPRWRVSTGRSG